MLDLNKFSPENLVRFQEVLKIILDEIELYGKDELVGNVIPMEKFEKKELSRRDIISIFNRINGKDNLIRLVDSEFADLEFCPGKTELEKMEFSLQRQAEAERYIGFIVINLEELKKIKEKIDKKLIEEFNERQKELSVKWFNYKNNSISFYGNIYKPRNKPQAKLIRQLVMRYQRENNNGTVLKEGQRVSENNLSNEINLTIEQLRHIKKQLKRSFKDKGFPLKIDSDAEGILLIYTI